MTAFQLPFWQNKYHLIVLNYLALNNSQVQITEGQAGSVEHKASL